MIKNIYICGNQLVDEDNGPYELLVDLRMRYPDVNFVEFDPSEEFPEDQTVYIIDTVINASRVMVIQDIDSFEDSPNVSAHDNDLAFNLKFLRKLGKLSKVIIFGIPVIQNEDDKERVLAELILLLDNIF